MKNQSVKRNYAAEIIQIIDDAKKEHARLAKEHKYLDEEYNDLIHALEFLKLNAAELVIKAGEVKRNREARRHCKEMLELNGCFIKWCDDQTGALFELKRAAQSAEAFKKAQSNRIYTPRIHTELTQRFRRDTRR